MATQDKFFNKIALGIISVYCLMIGTASDAAVVSRTQRPSVTTRGTAVVARGTPTATETKTVSETKIENDEPSDAAPEFDESMFEGFTSEQDFATSGDDDESELAARIREQRNAANARDAQNIVTKNQQSDSTSGSNSCDSALRACMKSKCGDRYTDCAGDTDQSWGNKMDSCRLDTTCTGHEYAMLAPEIKADRDMNARISGFDSIIDCGNSYNDCIIQQCGKTFGKCLGKSNGKTLA